MKLDERRTRVRFFLACVVALVGAGAHSATADAAAFARCAGHAGRLGFQCGSVLVPLDRSGAGGGTLSLHVRRRPAGGFASKPPLVALAGGPGEGASNFAGMFAEVFDEALADRDLVVVDQRGTGLSGALRCASFETVVEDEDALAAAMRTCVASLSGGVAHYRTLDSVEDLEAVRASLGAERLALFGVSYGTKVALAYAARHPTRVERLVLDSIVNPDGPDEIWRSTFASIPRVLREVCGRECPFTSDPSADVAELVRQLASAPLRGTVVAPDGKRSDQTLSSAELFWLLLQGDFDPRLQASMPGAVAAAAKGDGAQLLRLLEDVIARTQPEQPQLFSTPLFYATTCSDHALPWGATESLEQRVAAARAQVTAIAREHVAPFDAATALKVGIPWMCRHWAAPNATAPSFGALPDVPALVLNGTLDLRTPLSDAQAVASQLPRARLIAVGGMGHSVVLAGPLCAEQATVAFLRGRATARRCLIPRWLRPERPAPRSLDELGGSGRARLATAARLTLRDVLRRLPLSTGTVTSQSYQFRGGGLRAGRYVAKPTRLILYSVEFVPGVTVSGSVRGIVNPFSGAIELARGVLIARAGGTGVRVPIAAAAVKG